MSQENLILSLITFFIALTAISMFIQAMAIMGVAKKVREMQDNVSTLMPQAKSILSKAESTIDHSKKNIVEITEKANQMMDLSKAQLIKLDSVITDASERAHVQLERAELVVDDAVSRVHESVAAVHGGVLKPIREIQGVAAGVRTAFSVLLRRSRPTVAQATQDDEMFI
jgi:F0F1-type ATP synthase membrane subunit b/b'